MDASGQAEPDYGPIVARIQRQQRVYRFLLALCGVALLAVGIAAWFARPAPAYLEAGGFSFAVCYPPEREHLTRPLSSADEGRLVLLYQRDGPQASQVITISTPQARGLREDMRYGWQHDTRGVWPQIVAADGAVLASGLPLDPAAATRHWPLYRRQLTDAASATRHAGPDQLVMELAIPGENRPRWFAQRGRQVAVVYEGGPGGTELLLARSNQRGSFGAGRTLPPAFMRGTAWRGGTQTFAHLTDDGRLFVYDFATGWFVEDSSAAGLAQRLRQSAPRDGYFYLADGFAVFQRELASVLLPAAGPEHVVRHIAPTSHHPNGQRKHWLNHLPLAWHSLLRLRRVEELTVEELAGEETQRYERMLRQQLREAPRVPANLGGWTIPVLVDGATVALVDTTYLRVTLVRRAGDGGAR